MFLRKNILKGARKYIVFFVLFFCFVSVFYLKDVFFEKFSSTTMREAGSKESLMVDGVKRTYWVRVPLGVEKQEVLPLVIILHGAGGNAQSAMESARANGIADKNGFIVVYPNGTGVFREYLLSWNAGGCCNYVKPLGVDDVNFIRRLIDKLKEERNIDSNKIYVAGISNGGMMVYRLGCELSDKLAAIAAVSSSMLTERCEPSDFLSVITFHNLDDRVVPFEGGESGSWIVKLFKLNFNPEKEAVSFWVGHNFCQGASTKEQEGVVLKETYTECKNNTEVVSYVIEEGGHSWPGGDKTWLLGGKPANYIVASEIIWDFFEKHPKK